MIIPLTKLFEAGAGLKQNVTDIVDSPGIQLAEGYLQKHTVEGRDKTHILQAVKQRFSAEDTW